MTYPVEQARFRATRFDDPAPGGRLFVRALAFGLSLGLSALVFVAGWAGVGTADTRSPEENKRQSVAFALADAAVAENAMAARGANAAAFHTNLAGGAGQVGTAASAFAREIDDTYSAYYATLSTMNYYQLLVPMRIDGDPGFVKTNQTLERMRAAVETRERRLNGAVAVFRARLASAGLDDKAKRIALARLDRVAVANNLIRRHETALEERLIDEQKTMLAYLSAHKKSWRATGPTVLVFHDAGAMKTYNAHVAALMKIARALDVVIGTRQGQA